MTNLHIDALLAIRAAVTAADLKWTREVREAIKQSELSTNLWLCDRERFDSVLESELTYFTDTGVTP